MTEPIVNVNETDLKIAAALDAEKGQADDLIRLSTGVVLRAKQVNPSLMIRIMTKDARPAPPLVTANGRTFENPDDPDYISRVKSWEMAYNGGMLNVLVGEGTELATIPKGMEGPHPAKGTDKLEWVEKYRSYGLPTMEDSESWRYITWVLFKAAVNEKDIALIGEKVKGLSGVKEADVKAAETFPGRN